MTAAIKIIDAAIIDRQLVAAPADWSGPIYYAVEINGKLSRARLYETAKEASEAVESLCIGAARAAAFDRLCAAA